MDRMEFLNELSAELAGLARADRRQVLDYYNEMILDGVESGIAEETVVAGLGDPEQVAAQVRAGYDARQAAAQGQAGYDAGQGPAQRQAEYGTRPVRDPENPLEYTFEGTGLRIEIRARDTSIELRRAKSGRPRVLAYGCREEWLTPEVTGEAFRLTLRVPLFFSNFWFLLQTGVRRRLVVELPEGFADGANIKTTNASITGEGLRLDGRVKLNTSNGTVTLEDCRFDTLSANSSNGGMTLTGLSGQKCKAETSNGRILAEDCHFARKLLLSTSNGAVRVADIEAPVIGLTTSNGPIKGWVRGREDDYAVTSGTSNARNELQDTSACADRPGRLLAGTSNAPIKLSFAESEEAQEEAAWAHRHNKNDRSSVKASWDKEKDDFEDEEDEEDEDEEDDFEEEENG